MPAGKILTHQSGSQISSTFKTRVILDDTGTRTESDMADWKVSGVDLVLSVAGNGGEEHDWLCRFRFDLNQGNGGYMHPKNRVD